jgi:CTP:molybdopterin cytidylyltransferase MocA
VPEFSGKHGHPFLAGRELIEAFLQAPPTTTARDIEHRYQDRIRYVTVNDPFVALNINTPEDYAALPATPIN